MKKFTILIMFLFIFSVGCTSLSNFFFGDRETTVVGDKKGVVTLRTGEKIPFSQSYVLVDQEYIRIRSHLYHYTFLWGNVRSLELINPSPVEEKKAEAE